MFVKHHLYIRVLLHSIIAIQTDFSFQIKNLHSLFLYQEEIERKTFFLKVKNML